MRCWLLCVLCSAVHSWLGVLDRCSAPHLIDRVYEHVYNTRLAPVLSTKDVEVVPEPVQLHRAFVKWMIGQLALMARYGEGSGFNTQAQLSHVFCDKIKRALMDSNPATFTLDQVNACRSFYEYVLRSVCLSVYVCACVSAVSQTSLSLRQTIRRFAAGPTLAHT
jgi:hypothetical protein